MVFSKYPRNLNFLVGFSIDSFDTLCGEVSHISGHDSFMEWIGSISTISKLFSESEVTVFLSHRFEVKFEGKFS